MSTITSSAGRGIDPRSPQVNAAITTVVLAAVLLTAPGVAGVVLLGLQAVLFALGVGLGVQRTPAAYFFKSVVRPRLAPPTHLEDPAPPRFAQGVGLAFAVVGLLGYLSGVTVLGAVATGMALAAALLNAAFGFCLGCEMYLLIKRVAPGSKRSRATTPAASTTTDNHIQKITEKEEVSA